MNETVSGDRFVLPQWLSFRKASLQREHSVFLPLQGREPVARDASTEYLQSLAQFNRAPHPFIASELMGMALTLGEMDVARQVAQYVVTQPTLGPVALAQANQILRPVAEIVTAERQHIATLKERLRGNPHDAISWIERARLYTSLGQMEKARASVMAALHLTPENRHIVRAAIRFFVHQEDWTAALAVAQRAHSLNPDPLIFGPLLSVGTRLDRLPKRMKPQLSDALASTDRFLFSEVLGAAGTLELVHGADQRSRKLFREAWIDPTNSVISHSQWVLRERLPGMANEQRIDFRQSPEALGWLRHLLLDFRGSVFASNAWALDEPYSRGAYILGSSSACLTGDFLLAEQIAQAGHKANPKEHVLINNLGFAQLHNGRIQAAEETLRPLERQLDDESQVAPSATFGMLRLAQKRETEGEALYARAVQRALKARNRPLALRATLNYVFSSISLLKKVDIGTLDASARALKDFGDAGCIGVAEVISRRLQNSDLQGTDDLTNAAMGFIHATAIARENHLKAVNSRFHDALLLQTGPEEGGAASLSFQAPVPKKGIIKASEGAPTTVPMLDSMGAK